MKEQSKQIIKGYAISRETLEHLDPLHRLVAEKLIRDGRWKLKDPVEGEAHV